MQLTLYVHLVGKRRSLLSARLRKLASFSIKFQNNNRTQLFYTRCIYSYMIRSLGVVIRVAFRAYYKEYTYCTFTNTNCIVTMTTLRGRQSICKNTVYKKLCSMAMCLFLFFFFFSTHNGLQNFVIAHSFLTHCDTRREVPGSILGTVLGNFK